MATDVRRRLLLEQVRKLAYKRLVERFRVAYAAYAIGGSGNQFGRMTPAIDRELARINRDAADLMESGGRRK